MFDVFKAFGLAAAGLAQVELAHVRVAGQALGRAVDDDLAAFHDVAAVRHGQGHGGVLLDQQHRGAALGIDAGDDGEDVFGQLGREAQRGLVEQDELGLGDEEVPEPSRTELRRLKSEIDHAFRRLVEQGVQEGVLAPCDPKMAAFVIAGGLSWIGRWYQPQGAYSADQIIEQCTQLLLQGVLARPAHSQ